MCCLSFLSTASPCKSVFNIASSSLATWTGPADLGDGILVRDSSSESKTVDVICSGRKDLFVCRAFHDCVPFVGNDIGRVISLQVTSDNKSIILPQARVLLSLSNRC